MNSEIVVNYLQQFSYVGIFVFTALAGILIPIPEEVVLLLVGYLSGARLVNPYIAAGISIVALLGSDSLLFWLSQRGNRYIEKLRHKLRQNRVYKYEELMKANIGKTIFLLRFIVGLRFIAPVLAGSAKIRWRKFALFDLSALIIYVSLLIFLGYYFHNRVVALITEVEIIRHVISLVSLTIIGWLISLYIHKQFLAEDKGKSINLL